MLALLSNSLFCLLLVEANLVNQQCAGNSECDNTKNLICKDGICVCKDNTLYWNDKTFTCGKQPFSEFQSKEKNVKTPIFNKATKFTINEKCSSNEQCNDLAGLSCQNGVCKCAENSIWMDNKCGLACSYFLSKSTSLSYYFIFQDELS